MLKSRTCSARSCLVLIVGAMLLVSGVIFWTWVSNPCIWQQCLYGDKPRLAVSRDGNVAAIAGQEVSDPTVRRGVRFPVDFYDTGSGALISTYDDSQIEITNMALTGDGTLLACSTTTRDLRVIDVPSGSEIYMVFDGDSFPVEYPRWNSDGAQVATFYGGTLEIVGVDPNERRSRFFRFNEDYIAAYDWSDDGSTIAVSLTRDILFQPKYSPRQDMLAVLGVDGGFTLRGRFNGPTSDWIEVNTNGSLVATSTPNGILITNTTDGSQQTLQTPSGDGSLLSVAWNPLEGQIAGGTHRQIYVWDLASGDVVQTIEVTLPARDIFWSPDGQYLFHAGPQGVYRNGTPLSVSPATTPPETSTAESSS